MINFTKRLKKDKILEVLRQKGAKVYFVGIGGISMSSLALILKERGIRVAGSDIKKTQVTENLQKRGIHIRYSHSREAIMSFAPDLVVFSLSLNENNAEYKAVLDMNINAVSRAELLGAIMVEYETSIGISGSHGKSTVTAMIGEILTAADLKPTLLCGAEIVAGAGVVIGGKNYLVYESCEYGDSFLEFQPDIQVLLNLDMDHTDYFKSEEMIKDSFLKSANTAKSSCVLNLDSKNLASICDKIIPAVHTFSKGNSAEYRYEMKKGDKGVYSFKLYKRNEFIGEYHPSLKGEFNALNAVAAAVSADVVGVPYLKVKTTLESFKGIKRRLELIKKTERFDVFYDYAHHPCEIKASNQALHDMGYKRITAVFAPHTYSRTAYFLKDFASELSKFETAYIAEIYGARESAVVGISSLTLANAVNNDGGNSHAVSDSEICDMVRTIESSDTDCVVLLGAGNVEKYKEEFMKI